MITAALISIGSEIMKGRIDDTNSTFLSKWLYEKNITVKWRLSVGDDAEDIASALNFAENAEIIILTGGLGPTEDDITREALSFYLKKKLIFNEDKWLEVQSFFKKRNISIPESNKKQAMLIEGGNFIDNKAGTAPGMYYAYNNKIYFLLPGPPAENQIMAIEHLSTILKGNDFIKGDIFTQIIRIYNAGESEIADLISTLNLKCEIGYYFTKDGWVEIHVTKRSDSASENREAVNLEMNAVKDILTMNSKFITEDEDLSLLVLNKLIEKKMTLSFAESMTGGALSSEFVKNSGASAVFKGGIIAYSNKLKADILKVSQNTLDSKGAVSDETALEMVRGLKQLTGADICVSVTGIAGPSGATNEKPVGLFYAGFIFNDRIYIKKELFFGSRERIIRRCINYIMMEILKNA